MGDLPDYFNWNFWYGKCFTVCFYVFLVCIDDYFISDPDVFVF